MSALSPWSMWGWVAILLAVFLVTSSKMKSGKPNVVDEDLAVRQQA